MTKNLLPSDYIQDEIDDGIKALKGIRPTGQLTFSTLTQEEYDSILGVLTYCKKAFSRSRPFCKECRNYYGLTIEMNCIKCQLNGNNLFSKLRERDFEKNYKNLRAEYKGKAFKHLLLTPQPKSIIRIEDNGEKEEPIDELDIMEYPDIIPHPNLSPSHKANQEKMKKLKKQILEFTN